jgi:hypothetical protein
MYVFGFVIAKTMLLIIVIGNVYNWPNSLTMAAFGFWITLNTAMVGGVVYTLHINPQIGNLSPKDALKTELVPNGHQH